MTTTAAPAAPTQGASRHVAAQGANIDGFLRYARTKYYPLAGTIPTGAVGGVPASNVTFSDQIPAVPAWATSVVFEVTLPIALTLPAGASVRVSPFFPYSAVLMGLTLAGSPPWDVMSLAPWYLDNITNSRGYDPAGSGVVPGAEANDADAGPFAYTNGGFTPGGTITNGGGAPATTNGTVKFRVKCNLQRNPRLLFGAIPMGDPENRPKLTMQLAALVGPNPELNAFQDTAAAGATASLSAPATITAVIKGKSLDVLPPGIGNIPTPEVGMGLAVTYTTQTQAAAGQIFKMKHSTAMLYEKVLHLLINGQVAQRADYFANWLTGEQQSARQEFDASQGTFNEYYEEVFSRYRRYLPTGVYINDLVGGFNPDDPGRDPYDGQQTPDTGYAAEFGLAATPAWTTALRIPVGTGINGAYAALYEFGLVNVPY